MKILGKVSLNHTCGPHELGCPSDHSHSWDLRRNGKSEQKGGRLRTVHSVKNKAPVSVTDGLRMAREQGAQLPLASACVPRAAKTKCRRPGGLNNRNVSPSLEAKEGQGQDVGRALPPVQALGKDPSWLLPASGGRVVLSTGSALASVLTLWLSVSPLFL